MAKHGDARAADPGAEEHVEARSRVAQDLADEVLNLASRDPRPWPTILRALADAKRATLADQREARLLILRKRNFGASA